MPDTRHHHATSTEDGHGHHGSPQAHAHDHDQAQVLDLDAEVLAEHIASITAWLPVRVAPREIVDLGAGTGAGTFALLGQFPDAHLTAVDSSPGHLERLRSKVQSAGLSDRVRVAQVDLDTEEWPDLGSPDLVWASASMHHLADPGRALGRVRDLLAPDGLIAVMELSGLPRFLPPTAPDDSSGLEERCHAATQQRLAEHMPHRGADWGPVLTGAGFTVVDSLTVEVNVDGTDENAVGAYALAALQGIRKAAAAAISADDLAALDRLLDTAGPDSVLRRDDLAVRTTRTIWVARRTGADQPFSAAAEAANCERVLGDRLPGGSGR
ncbi:MAG TPA: class I SAM-dependent methyltransferase [Microlunatus sp.]